MFYVLSHLISNYIERGFYPSDRFISTPIIRVDHKSFYQIDRHKGDTR